MKSRVREALATEGKSFCSLIETSGAYHDAKFIEDRSPDFFALYDLLCPGRYRLFYGAPGESVGGFAGSAVRAPAWSKEVFWANDFYVAQNNKSGADFVTIIRRLTDWLSANCQSPFLYGIEHNPYSLQRLVRLLNSVGFQMDFVGWSSGCALTLPPEIPKSVEIMVREADGDDSRSEIVANLNRNIHPLARVWSEKDLAHFAAHAKTVRFLQTEGASALAGDVGSAKRFRDRQGRELRSLSLGSLRADSAAAWENFLTAASAYALKESFDMIFFRDPPFQSSQHKPAVFLRRAFAIYFTGQATSQEIAGQMKGFRSDAFAI